MLALGYNVVQLNYAFAPAYKYPTALKQVAQAVAFLRLHAAEYGLDMTRVVVGGGSAGGHAAGQFALLQTNPAYARAVGIAPVLDRRALQAIVLESAALDPSRAATTRAASLAHDFQFGAAVRSYFGVAGPVNGHSRSLEQANIITHVTADFPTTFVGDGNFGTFPDQARDLAARLRVLGVPYDLVLYDGVDAKLGHSFMILPSRWTDDYLAKKHAFLRQVLATGNGP